MLGFRTPKKASLLSHGKWREYYKMPMKKQWKHLTELLVCIRLWERAQVFGHVSFASTVMVGRAHKLPFVSYPIAQRPWRIKPNTVNKFHHLVISWELQAASLGTQVAPITEPKTRFPKCLQAGDLGAGKDHLAPAKISRLWSATTEPQTEYSWTPQSPRSEWGCREHSSSCL